MPAGKLDLIPKMARISQAFARPQEVNIESRVFEELGKVFAKNPPRRGAQIGITAGSRGISNIAEITRSAVRFLRSIGVEPFIIPAMGSHGGAGAEAQQHLIEHYGITEQAVEAPIRPAMETLSLGKTNSGVEAVLAKTALDSDGILLLNRIKPHTDIKGDIESGLVKICGIGLGKLDGAAEYHSHLFTVGLGQAIKDAAELVFAKGVIVGGLGIIENAYHETASLVGVPVDSFFEQEAKLLREARSLMPKVPVAKVHVLLADQMGKNISGSGMDTNIINRSVRGFQDVSGWQPSGPIIRRIVVNDLTDESDGNAVGMGMVDFITERFHNRIDYYVTSINGFTSCGPHNVKTPVVLKNTREALAIAIETCGKDKLAPKVVYIRDTLSPTALFVSEACLPELEGRDGVEGVTKPQTREVNSERYIVRPWGLMGNY